MGTLIIALLFLTLSAVGFALANRYVKRWLPKPWLESRPMMGVASVVLVFASACFITAWGFDPAVIQINLRQTLDPLRWVNWFLSALSFGVAQSFLLELLRRRPRVERTRKDVPSLEQGTVMLSGEPTSGTYSGPLESRKTHA